jgi:hypothetical protein
MRIAILLAALTLGGCVIPTSSYAIYNSASPAAGGVVYLTGQTNVMRGGSLVAVEPWVLECSEIGGDTPRLKCRRVDVEGAPMPKLAKPTDDKPMFGGGAIDL